MAEFKINSGIESQISAFKSAGSALNDSYSATSSSGVSSLSTAKAYIEEQKNIKKMLELYASLVSKDAADLDAMVKAVKAADEAAASSYA